jgi:hypothetical protein
MAIIKSRNMIKYIAVAKEWLALNIVETIIAYTTEMVTRIVNGKLDI